jgi:hypothetical protein
LARKFLYIVGTLTALAIAGMIAFSFFGAQIMEAVLKPRGDFMRLTALPADTYSKASGWLSRPDGRQDDPAEWRPEGGARGAEARPVAVFFIHPTSLFDASRWNGALDDGEASAQATRFVRAQASAFNGVGRIWAPRYRQATFGAFLVAPALAQPALDAAYGDVARAFDAFLAGNPEGPIILAGHSQGALHLLRLLKERVAGKPLAGRIVGAYAVGWPISVSADMPALGLPACSAANQAGCIMSWQSFGPGGDTKAIDAAFDAQTGLAGKPRLGTSMLCTNPLTGGADPASHAASSKGGLIGDGVTSEMALIPALGAGANCAGRGYLMLDRAPELGRFVLPGANYHVYDYALFWGNIRADAAQRLAAWQAR